MGATANTHSVTGARFAVPAWIGLVGWACVLGSAGFAVAVRHEIATLPAWEIKGGFIDFFLPGPRAVAMLLWELGHLWLLVIAVTLLVNKKRGCTLRSRDRLLLLSLLAGLIAGGVLVGELAERGVHIGIPGVDHHWGQIFF
jgi:hypothetical protein